MHQIRKEIVSIQFLRFVAATLVVFYHSTVAVQKNFAGISDQLLYVSRFGAVGVHIFFVISGFVMVRSSFNRPNKEFSASNFLIKRITRIYPIYILYCGLYLLFYTLIGSNYDLTIMKFIGSIFLLPGYSSYIIGPGWTLSYEMYFYACFALSMVLGLSRGIYVLTGFFILAIASRVLLDTSQPTIHVFTDALLLEFLLGAWLGYATVLSIRVTNALSNIMLVFALSGFLAGWVFGYQNLSSVIAWGIPSALLVAGAVFKETNGRVAAIVKKYAFLGDSSYSLYLLHILVIDAALLLILHFDKSLKTNVAFLGAFSIAIFCLLITGVCIAVAYLAYELIERRLVKFLQNYRRKIVTSPEVQ